MTDTQQHVTADSDGELSSDQPSEDRTLTLGELERGDI